MSNYQTYYHWGDQFPHPVPFDSQRCYGQNVVFLTKTPERVAIFHDKFKKNLYIFQVPKAVERASSPHWYDRAQQIIVFEHNWLYCSFIGKASSQKRDQCWFEGKKLISTQTAPYQGRKISSFAPKDFHTSDSIPLKYAQRKTLRQALKLKIQMMQEQNYTKINMIKVVYHYLGDFRKAKEYVENFYV